MPANYDYLSRIRSLLALHSRHMSDNALEGAFRSTRHSRSMEFEDLREYVWGDEVRDIDWRSSARTGTVLVRRFVAERRHSVLVVADCGAKMDASSSFGEDKATLACDAVGTIAYMALLHGDEVGLVAGGSGEIEFTGFRSSRGHAETLLARYDRISRLDGVPLSRMVDHVADGMGRRAIVFVVTDMDGLETLDDRAIARLSTRNDVMVVDIDDAYLAGDLLWDAEAGDYEARAILADPSVAEAERAERRARLEAADARCRRHGAHLAVIGRAAEIPDRMVELLQEARERSVNF